jgi:Zn-dependent protease with chaperone function
VPLGYGFGRRRASRWLVIRRTLPIILLSSVTLIAQPSAVVALKPTPTGNVEIHINTTAFSKTQVETVLKDVPRAFGCRWAGRQRNPNAIDGVCRAWLANSSTLRLAPLTARLHEIAAETVTIEVTLSRSQHIAIPQAWIARNEEGSATTHFRFISGRPDMLPPDFPVRMEVPIPLSRILAPIAIVLLVPAMMAFAIRWNAARTSATVNWLAWTNWIGLCSWLYWITAMNAGDLGEFMVGAWFDSYLATFVVAALLYSLPPLAAVAIVSAISTNGRMVMLKRRLLGEAVMITPFSVFLVGVGLSSAGWGYAMFGMVVAYVAFRILVWFHWSANYAAVTPIESGDLFQRATGMAKKAGITLARLSLLRTKLPEEANAFAAPGDAIILTESLVKSLPARELDAVLAHELGHHKSGHLRFSPSRLLFWGYMLGAEPVFGWLVHHFHLPQILLTLPIAPLLFMMLQSRLSQRREFEADVCGVEITGDPEAAIAALARMARLSRVPTNTSGISGSILSHPSIEGRGLSIARRFGVSDSRALAILRNPEEACGGEASPVIGGESTAPRTSVFSLRERALFSEQLRWLRLLAPLAGGCLVAIAMTAASFLPAGSARIIAAMAGSMFVLGLTLGIEILWSRRIASRLRNTLTALVQPTPGAIFAGLHPGRGVRFTEGFPDWDFGFVTLEGDWLCYRGEKTRFAIARQDISAVDIAQGPISWLRERRVEITCSAGSFTLSADIAHPSKAKTNRIATWLRSWTAAASSEEPAGLSPEPAPELPRLPGIETTRVRGAVLVFDTGLKLAVAAALTAILAWHWIPANIILLAPFAGIARILPRALWPIRRPLYS